MLTSATNLWCAVAYLVWIGLHHITLIGKEREPVKANWVTALDLAVLAFFALVVGSAAWRAT